MRSNIDKLVIATRNKGKASEFRSMLSPLGIEVLSLLDIDAEVPDVEEDGDTFAANAEKKAKSAAEALGVPTLADDSGLCVDALGGAPGVRSARYAEEPSSDERNNAKLLSELAGIGAKQHIGLSDARFVCALVLYDPRSGETVHAEGSCEGVIVSEPRGANGFGYDPLFYVPDMGKTFGEMSDAEKNRISHRGRALLQLKHILEHGRSGL